MGGGHGVIVEENVDLDGCSEDSLAGMAPCCVGELGNIRGGRDVEESDVAFVCTDSELEDDGHISGEAEVVIN